MKPLVILLAGLLLTGAAAPDVPVSELNALADRLYQAETAGDRAALEALTAPDLVFIRAVRMERQDFLNSWSGAGVHYEPFRLVDRYVIPLGPDAGIVGGRIELRGRIDGQAVIAILRVSTTFRRVNGRWRAVHIQETDVPIPTIVPEH